MFNGIINNTGRINKIEKKSNNCLLFVKTKMNFKKKEIGSSVSCSGACLTIEKIKKDVIQFYLSKETLNKTTFKLAKKGDIINLEKPLTYGQPISGHFVQGHVDATSSVKKIYYLGKSWLIDFKIQKKYSKHIVQKGSITINGISLTIAKKLKNGFQIAVIPKTLELTNLIAIKKKGLVNVELDILSKYKKSKLKLLL
jgi:riboflavin synthase